MMIFVIVLIWLAFADIGHMDIRVNEEELPPPVGAQATRWYNWDGSLAWCHIETTVDDYWVLVHEYGHCYGLSHADQGVMKLKGGGTEITLGNIEDLRTLWPPYAHKLTVGVARD